MFSHLNYLLKISQKYKFVFQSSLFVLISSSIQKILTIISYFFVASFLGITSYGVLSFILTFTLTLVHVINLNLNISLNKYLSEYSENNSIQNSLFSFSFSLFIISCIVFIFISALFSNYFIKILNISAFSYIFVCLSIILSSFSTIMLGIFNGLRKFNLIATLNFTSAFFSTAFLLFFSYHFFIFGSIFSIFLSNLLLSSLCIIILLPILKNKIKIFQFSLKECLPFFTNFNLPNIIGSIVTGFSLFILSSIITNGINGFQEFAVINISQQWQSLIQFVPTVLSSLFLSILSRKSSNSKLKRNFLFIFIIVILINIILVLLSLFYSNYILSLYGVYSYENLITFSLFIISSLFLTSNSLIGVLISSKFNLWYGLLFNVIWSFSLLLLFYFLNSYLDFVLAYSLSYLFSYFIHLIIQTVYILFKFLK